VPPFPLFLFRTVGAFLRRFFPILRLRGKVFVTRHADVTEILRRDRDFTIAEINGPTIEAMAGPFILGMDCPEYGREARILRGVVQPEDPDTIFDVVSTTAGRIVDQAKGEGSIDAVDSLTRAVPIDLVDRYFGVPAPDGDRARMRLWMRTLFHGIFLNLSNEADIRDAALHSADDLQGYLDDLIAQRKRSGEASDTVLGRLIAMQEEPATRLDHDGVRRNITGLIVGAVDTTSKACTLILDQVLRRPRVVERCREAAREHDLRRLWHLLREALRFNPHNPIVLRHCARDTALGSGRHTTWIREGSTVYAVTLSAMVDGRAFPHPKAFRDDRYDADYLHFGYGLHSCFGQYVNEVSIPALLAPLLRLDGLRRAAGKRGRIAFDGPFPSHMVVEFDA